VLNLPGDVDPRGASPAFPPPGGRGNEIKESLESASRPRLQLYWHWLTLRATSCCAASPSCTKRI